MDAKWKHKYLIWLAVLVFGAILTGSGWVLASLKKSGVATASEPVTQLRHEIGLGELLDMSPAELAKVDIAEMNLLCATGLNGSEDLDIRACLRTLDEWAEGAKRITSERLYIYRKNPEKWKNSENWWRIGALVSYLNEIVGISYNPALRDFRSGRLDTRAFRSSRDVFIHGLLTGKKHGTCSSIPVLVVAVGRRMGYPLKFVRGAGHLFARWDDGKERFNIESTDRFAESKPDSFYHNWPRPNNLALESLTPVDELVLCLGFRGCCLMENKRLREAEVAFAHGSVLVPEDNQFIPYLERLLMMEQFGGIAPPMPGQP